MFIWGLRRLSETGRIIPGRPASGPVIGKEVIAMLEAILNFLLAVAAGVMSMATMRMVPTLCIAVTETKVKSTMRR